MRIYLVVCIRSEATIFRVYTKIYGLSSGDHYVFPKKIGMAPKHVLNSKFRFLALDFSETLTKHIPAVMFNIKSVRTFKLAIVHYMYIQNRRRFRSSPLFFFKQLVQAVRWNIAKNDVFKVKKIFIIETIVRFVIWAPNNPRIRHIRIFLEKKNFEENFMSILMHFL